MTVNREFYVRDQYWTVQMAQEQNEWIATCKDLPGLALRGMYRNLVNAIPTEIERLVPVVGKARH